MLRGGAKYDYDCDYVIVMMINQGNNIKLESNLFVWRDLQSESTVQQKLKYQLVYEWKSMGKDAQFWEIKSKFD